jgi:hypothetical protein
LEFLGRVEIKSLLRDCDVGVRVGVDIESSNCKERTKNNKQDLQVATERKAVTIVLDFVRTRAAGLEFAVFALEDVPVRSGMAHRAHPLNKCRLRLKQVERVVAITW